MKNKRKQNILDPVGKANLLADTFRAKCKLPDSVDYAKEEINPKSKMTDFTLVRSRWVLRIIKNLEEGKASGPDGLPVRFFKECAKELAPIIVILVRFLLRTR